jgi:predicted cupin superfamily sugar epimerase
MKMMDRNAEQWADMLQMAPHPEGGWYRETYRSEGSIPADALAPVFDGERSFCTSILFLLTVDSFSAFHRIKSDELWHFHTGDAIVVHEITLMMVRTPATCLAPTRLQGSSSNARCGQVAGSRLRWQRVAASGWWAARWPRASTSATSSWPRELHLVRFSHSMTRLLRGSQGSSGYLAGLNQSSHARHTQTPQQRLPF